MPALFGSIPGGARAILMVEGRTRSPSGEQHAQWCAVLMQWLLSLDCPTQLVSVISNFDSRRAQNAFDERTKGFPFTRLLELERDLAGRVAEQSLVIPSHFVVLAPGIAAADGIPWLSRITRLPRAIEASDEEASRVLQSALRTATGLGIVVSVPDRDALADALVDTVVGTSTGNERAASSESETSSRS